MKNITIIFLFGIVIVSCSANKHMLNLSNGEISINKEFRIYKINNVNPFDPKLLQKYINSDSLPMLNYNIFTEEKTQGFGKIFYLVHRYDIGLDYCDLKCVIYLNPSDSFNTCKIQNAFFSESCEGFNLWKYSSGSLCNVDNKVEFILNFEKIYGMTSDFEDWLGLENNSSAFILSDLLIIKDDDIIELNSIRNRIALEELIR